VPPQRISVFIVALGPEVSLENPTPQTIDNLAKQTQFDPARLQKTIAGAVTNYKTNKELVAKIAEQEGLPEKTIEQVVAAHLPTIADPASHIEDSVVVPASVSIEDYEEVKSMWTDQYEKGEVPVSDTIKDRKEWLSTDILAITNILNKLLSADTTLRSQALDEIGYILPIFMVNNLKGEELAVYLKAKLEAAKQVKQMTEKSEAAQKQAVGQEEFIDIDKPKAAEAEKTMEMKQELPEPAPSKTEEQKVADIKERLNQSEEEKKS
jgi:hypothetical protein